MAEFVKDEVVAPLQEFARSSRHLIDKCNKPDREGIILTNCICF